MKVEETDKLDRKIDERSMQTIKKFMQAEGFTSRKITDTPTEAFSLVNRKFVTANGVVASRPKSSVAVVGQTYFATDTGIPMTYSAGGWRNGVGSVVAGHL